MSTQRSSLRIWKARPMDVVDRITGYPVGASVGRKPA